MGMVGKRRSFDVTFLYICKPNGKWIWWLASEPRGRESKARAQCTEEFDTRGECLRDVREVALGVEEADIREGVYRGAA